MPAVGDVPGGGGPFEAAYLAPVAAVAPPPATVESEELVARAAPAQPFALHGCVLTPDRRIDDGYVVVGAGSEISAVTKRRPPDVPVVETGGVILPGLIDLHGHPEFNVFAAWEPPQRFINRYQWRGSEVYRRLVREPQDLLLRALPAKTQLRYSEVRALVGGVTAIQGTGGTAPSYRSEQLVRNVDKVIFGGQVGRSMVDLPSGSRGADDLASILAGITAGDVKAFYVHLAEGQASNPRSRNEFRQLVELNALTASTVVIHGTALTGPSSASSRTQARSWSGHRRATSASTARPRRSRTRSPSGSPSRWARTGCPAAAPACWPR